MEKKRKRPIAAFICYGFAVLSLVLFLFCLWKPPFADYFSTYPAGFVRMVLAKLTGILPFSLAEFVILAVPLLIIWLVIHVIRLMRREDDEKLKRFFVNAFAVVALLFSLFVWTCGSGYHTTTLDKRMGLPDSGVSAEELKETAQYLTNELNGQVSAVTFGEDGFSVMPYDFKELNSKLCDAYENMAAGTGLLRTYSSRLKPVLLSEGMSKLHFLGMYTYYTGESNINMKFPDYTLPYTCAHELAHQRGYSREEEANFIAYLVCMASDDPYLRYSGTLNLTEYVYDALYQADKKAYKEVLQTLNKQTLGELRAYADFYARYENSKAAVVSEKVNDVYLKTQGQSSGVKSYGLVADLAVAYLREGE